MSDEQIYLKKENGKTKRVVVKRVRKMVKLKATVSKGKGFAKAATPKNVQENKLQVGKRISNPAASKEAARPESKAAGKSHHSSAAFTKNKSFNKQEGFSSNRAGGPRKQTRPGSSAAKYNSQDQRQRPGYSSAEKGFKTQRSAPSFSAGEDGSKHSKKKSTKKKEKIYITKKKKSNADSSFGLASSKKKYRKPRQRFKIHEDGLSDESSEKRERGDSDLSNIPSSIEIPEIISIKNLAKKLNLKASFLVKKFFSMGIMDISVNNSIEAESAVLVCAEFNCRANVVSLAEQTRVDPEKGKDEDYQGRSPVVTIMGHVDHGKTTLLDAIRNTKIADAEQGGITQHVSAYSVLLKSGSGQKSSSEAGLKSVLFVDTPGHSAFFSMRIKGAKITDILVVAVAITEGMKPQTAEVLQLAKQAKLPVIVAVTKKDMLEESEIAPALEKIKQQFFERDFKALDWDGDVPFILLSAAKKEGIDDLLKAIRDLGEKLQLRANHKISGYGYVLEVKQITGRGNTALVVVKNGRVKVGDVYLLDSCYGKIRALNDEDGKSVKQLKASSLAEIIGLSEAVSSGQFFQILKNEKEARSIAEKRRQLETDMRASGIVRVDRSNLFSALKHESMKEQRLILKADTFGSAEALKESLENLKNDEVRVSVLNYGVGPVNENDLQLANTASSTIIAFGVKVSPKVKKMADMHSIEIKSFSIIYDVITHVKEQLSGLLGQDTRRISMGALRVKEIFKISSLGKVAGCTVLQGKIPRKAHAEVSRQSKVLHTGEIATLKRFQEDVSEVTDGQECGLSLKNFKDLEVDDTIEVFTIEKSARVFEAAKPVEAGQIENS